MRKAGLVGGLIVIKAEGPVWKAQDFVCKAHLKARRAAGVEGQQVILWDEELLTSPLGAIQIILSK